MSRNGSVDLDLAGETYRFRFGIGDFEELQEVTDVGPYEHLVRLYAGDRHTFRHAREVVRIGLIGGGLSFRDATDVARMLDDLPASEVAAVALLALAGGLEQPDAETLPERAAGRGGAKVEEPLTDGQMRFAGFYEGAAMMDLSVSEMRAMSLWQYAVYVAGFNRKINPDAPDPLTVAEEDALWEWMNTEPTGAAETEDTTDGN